MTHPDHEATPIMPDWVAQIHQRGWHNTLLTLLDMVEPIAPLIAQGLWVGQPVAERWAQAWQRDAWQGITHALESPSARATLRYHLEKPSMQEQPAQKQSAQEQSAQEQPAHHDTSGDMA